MKKQKYFNMREFIDYCGIDKNKVYQLIKCGKFPSKKIKGQHQFSAKMVYAYKRKLDSIKDMLTVKQFVQKHNLSYKKVLSDIRKGILKAKKIYGNVYYITNEAANSYIDFLYGKQFIGLCKFAEVVGVNRATVRNHIAKGTLPVTKLGGRYLISTEEIKKFKASYMKNFVVSADEKLLLQKYYAEQLQTEPDILMLKDICRLSGYSQKTIMNILEKENIFTVKYAGKYIVTKEDVIKLLISDGYNGSSHKSERHIKALMMSEII